MALSDAVAQQVLGEIHTLAKHIDAQAIALERTAKLTNDAATNVVAGIRQALRETEQTMQAMQKGTQVDIRFADQLRELNRVAAILGNAREDIPKEVRKIVADAREVAYVTMEENKGEAVRAFHTAAAETMEAATSEYKAELRLLGAGIAAVAVVVALLASMAGYVMGKQTGYAIAQAEAGASTVVAKKKGP